MFDPVDPKQSFPDLEKGILRYWHEEDIFKRSIRQRSKGTGDKWDGPKGEHNGKFSFYDGPPFATGLPHYGHLLAGTIKDVIPRYQTMRGKEVQRRFGWDCHGLPVENIIEKEHNITDHKQIEEMGVGKFNNLCRTAVARYCKEWRTVVERIGRWVDMDWDYRTMDPQYMESIWWVFGKLYEKGLIEEGHKPMHICPRCVTPLSNFEVTQGYEEITDQSVIAKFELVDEPGTFVLAWTTTPWTLPGNLFLALSKNLLYVKFINEGTNYVVAKDIWDRREDQNSILHHLMFAKFPKSGAPPGRTEMIGQPFKGSQLVDKTYKPLFPYFTKKYPTAFRIVEGDFVTTEDGTGVVHIAPGFGEDDYQVGKQEGLELLQHVTMDGRFTEDVKDFAGQEVKPADDPMKTDRAVVEWLEQQNLVFTKETYRHSYPHCWRCDSPLLNYATSSWFVKVEQIKEQMLNANAKTQWVPAHVRDGRFGKWLEGARDWAISRNRYWGTPLPIWRCEETGEVEVIGSRDDLMRHAPERFTKITGVRHAESEGNLIPIYQATPPGTDLTATGKKQAKETSKRFKEEEISVIYASPLARTQQTAAILAKETGAKVVTDDRLREVSFGDDYEGKTVDFSDLTFIKARRAHKMETNAPESIYHFPGMETWSSVADRIGSFMKDVLPRHRGEHIVVVTHADPIQNIKHFFTMEDPVKLSHQPYPRLAEAHTFYWDHETNAQMDLHKDTVDGISWNGSGSAGVDLTLVRHGETDWNKDKKIQGNEDTELNENGRKQATDLADKLSDISFDCIISSSLKRSIQTAKIVAKELGIPYEERWDELDERDFGDWTGKKGSEIDKSVKGQFAIQSIDYPNGETLDEFLSRVKVAKKKLIEKYKGKRVLVVAHGGVLRAMEVLTGSKTLTEAQNIFAKNAATFNTTLQSQFKRIPEVLDCWFESGSMPYAQSHYPFEHGDALIPPDFPADFIAEGMDQTRGWFYTLMVLSSALFKEPAFRNCIVNGIVLAEDGKKMSKKLQNYPEPTEMIDKYGADAIRFTLMSSPAVRGEDLRFCERLVEDSLRSVILPLWNTYSFFVTYANAAGFEPTDTRHKSTNPLDQWIIAEVQDLVNRMTKELDQYDLSATCNELHDTIDSLTNWYIRLSRRRFSGKGEEEDRDAALQTLHDVLLTLSQVLAPFCPFVTDTMYLNLVSDDHGSVHLTDWPETRDLTAQEQDLLAKTRTLRGIVSLGMSLRSEKKIKVRQPLQSATFALPPGITLREEDRALLKQELNVKDVTALSDPGELGQAIALVDARKVGPRLGKRVQEIINAGKNGDFQEQKDGSVLIMEETMSPDEVSIQYRGKEGQDVAADHGIVVSLDTEITDTLLLEGQSRDLIRAIQQLRKESGLEFTDHISLSINGADNILSEHSVSIAEETNATLEKNNGKKQSISFEGDSVTVQFEKK